MRDLAFYLRGRPGGGGANSVCQEFSRLAGNYGIGRLVVQPEHREAFQQAYRWTFGVAERIGCDLGEVPEGSVLVATTNDSVHQVIRAASGGRSRVYYYVQDFEPLFYAPSSRPHRTALESFAYANDVVAVVKTRWLQEMVLRHTFLPVVRIRPSIDRASYYPAETRTSTGRPVVTAMLRPGTTRRGTARTMAVLHRLVSELGDRVDVVTFGADTDELRAAGLRPDPRIRYRGRLVAHEAAAVVRRSDFLLDLSDYQAFGRTLAEGMAAGVVPIATRNGAPPEFIEHGTSGFLVDPSDLEASYGTLRSAVTMPADEVRAFRDAAILSVSEWSLDATALDWLALVADAT